VIRYTRHQLLLLLVILASAGAGLAVREWRARYPEVADRLESFDHEPGTGRFNREPRTGDPAAPDPAPASPLAPPIEAVGPAREKSRVAPRRPASGNPLDLNRATLEDLTRLPGVGAVLAARILEARQEAGQFHSVEDLREVRGLGGARLERLRPLLTVARP
jgi:competence ComEA-like helix-hairpin-helix protein